MKKFLSVLLALAVAFTFTFGSAISAFAYTDSEFNANVNTAQAEVVKALDTSYNTVVNNLKDTPYTVASGVVFTIEAAQWKVAAKKAYDDVAVTITAKANKIKADSNNKDKEVTDLVDAFYTGDGAVNVTASNLKSVMVNNYKAVAAYEQFGIEKQKYLDAIKTVDLSVYSDKEPKDATTYYAQASTILSDLTVAINAVTVAEDDSYDTIATAYKSIVDLAADSNGGIVEIQKRNADGQLLYKDAVTGLETTVASSNEPIMTGVWELRKSIHKIADDATDALTLDAEKKQALAVMNSKIATFALTIAAAVPSQQAALKEISDSYEIVTTYLINSADTKKSAAEPVDPSHKVETPTDISASDTFYAKNIAKYAELEKYAAKYAAEKDAYGNLVRSQEKIDKVLLAAKYAIYSSRTAVTDITSYQTQILNNCYIDTAVSDYAINSAKALVANAKKAIEEDDDYYAIELEKVNAKFDKLVSDLDAASTVADKQKAIAAIETALLKTVDGAKVAKTAAELKLGLLTGINTKLVVKGSIASFVPGAKLADYANYLNNGLTSTSNGYRNFVAAEMFDAVESGTGVEYGENGQDYWQDFYAGKGARTKAEVEALYATATAAIDAVPTVKEIATQKAAVEALINAIPSTVTVDNKAQVAEAFAAAVAYNKTVGKNLGNTDLVNVATLNKAIKAVADAEYKALAIAEAALPTSADKVTIADKAAVKAQADAVKAYNEEVADTENMYNGIASGFQSKAPSYVGKIRELELANVKALIDAIPVNVTEADKAAVEAAKAAYDAYVADYTDVDVYGADPANDIGDTYKKVLEDAITTLDLAKPAYDNQDAKADLLDMSRKLTIWRTSKTSIKVTAVGSVANIKANGYTVKYSFYKKAPGATSYKLVKTTTSNKYTYTNLKKGTNKFQVKVKVYDADGKLVATKMTYYRAAKIK